MTLSWDLGRLLLLLLLASSLPSPSASVGACSGSVFTCTLGVCVPADAVCDFTDDCGDGSDEEDCE